MRSFAPRRASPHPFSPSFERPPTMIMPPQPQTSPLLLHCLHFLLLSTPIASLSHSAPRLPPHSSRRPLTILSADDENREVSVDDRMTRTEGVAWRTGRCERRRWHKRTEAAQTTGQRRQAGRGERRQHERRNRAGRDCVSHTRGEDERRKEGIENRRKNIQKGKINSLSNFMTNNQVQQKIVLK